MDEQLTKRIEEALEAAKELYQETIDCVGSCDHESGICICKDVRELCELVDCLEQLRK